MTDQLSARFAELVGRPPAGVWSAPGRVNLIGEHVDYNDGVVLPFAIQMRTTVAVAPRDDGRLVARSLQVGTTADVAVEELAPGRVTGWASYVAGVVWATREGRPGAVAGGLDVVVDGRVPAGSGLSSSAALECAVALALDHLERGGRGPAELARLAQHAENDFVGVPCGLMDQMAAMVCTDGHALAFDVRAGTGEQVPLDVTVHGLDLLVVDTRAHHALADGAYAERRAACERAAAELGLPSLRDAEPADLVRLADPTLHRRATHVVTELARVREAVDALRAADYTALGALMLASHASLRDDYEVSCDELDVAVEAAMAAGALGARMTGGGFGGSVVALVPADRRDAVRREVGAAFAGRGFTAPELFEVVPSGGARRER